MAGLAELILAAIRICAWPNVERPMAGAPLIIAIDDSAVVMVKFDAVRSGAPELIAADPNAWACPMADCPIAGAWDAIAAAIS